MRIGLISDLHWMLEPPPSAAAWHGSSAELTAVLDRLQIALQRFAEQEVDLVVAAGDLAHHGEDDALAEVLAACAGASAPVLVVSGNHDLADDADRVPRAVERAGLDNVSLASLAGDVHGGMRVAGVQVGSTDGWFGARLRELPDTAAWAAEPVVLISHYPLLSLAEIVSANGFPYPGDLLDRGELATHLIARAAPTVVVGGHVHARAACSEGPVLQLTCAAMVEPPYECSVIEVQELACGEIVIQRTSTRLHEGPPCREPVFSPAREHWTFDGARWSTPAPPASRLSIAVHR